MKKQFAIQGWLLLSAFMLGGCGILQKSPKTELVDGFYIQKLEGKRRTVYVDIEEEVLRIHPTQPDKSRAVDTTAICDFFLPQVKKEHRIAAAFVRHSFDIDLLTNPLKLRPAANGVPAQLNANLNGALYIGYRTDRYVLNYMAVPLGLANRDINHFGVSFGAFSGFGNTYMSPTNTNNQMEQEYDGIVLVNGIAGIFAVNDFTLGLALGADHLLDQNRKIWIYQGQPWFGLVFGLNLN